MELSKIIAIFNACASLYYLKEAEKNARYDGWPLSFSRDLDWQYWNKLCQKLWEQTSPITVCDQVS